MRTHRLCRESTITNLVVGESLAYAEMRLIISRLLYAFDMSLADDKKEWISSQRAYFVWDKQPLMVNLRLAQ